MAPKNYYFILNVSNTEGQAAIRAAYRDLVKRMHPDRVGEEGTAVFQEINEAYEVLSDAVRRSEYNDELRRSEEKEMFQARPGEPTVRPEPLIFDRVSPFARPEHIRPSFESLHERLVRNFTGRGIPKSERLQSLNLTVYLSPQEAALGGRLPIGVPVLRICPHCNGSGRNLLFPCIYCDMQGRVTKEETVFVRIPPMVRPGTLIEIPLVDLGIQNLFLRVHIFVEDN
jgi:molecular chaperone DnaJ